MSPIIANALGGLLVAHQSTPFGFVLVFVPLIVLSLALRTARRRAERQLDDEPATRSS